MKKKLLFLTSIFLISFKIIFCQEPDSAPSTSESDYLDSLSIVFYQRWVNDSLRTDSLADFYNYPTIIYNDDSTDFIQIRTFYNDTLPVYTGADDMWQAIAVNNHEVWPNGGSNLDLTGDGITIGEWDQSAVLTDHQEFMNQGISRVTIRDGTSFDPELDHSTHVAGIMIGQGLDDSPINSIGMAYEAEIWDYDWNNDHSELMAAAADNIRVSNHSYGIKIGWVFTETGTHYYFNTHLFGEYTSGTEHIDEAANAAKYLVIVRSAGNDRDDDDPGGTHTHDGRGEYSDSHPSDAEAAGYGGTGFGTIGPAGSAKNIISVGAVSSYVFDDELQDINMTSFSNWGPTKDGRIKPDIVADGFGVNSAVSSANDAYFQKNGTSMSAPSVAGSIALLLELEQSYYSPLRMLSSTIKALVLHTADDRGKPGPDYRYGWGLMDTEKAANLMKEDYAERPCGYIREYTLEPNGSIEFYTYSDGSEPIKATICWNDPAGTGSSTDLVNDLELRLIKVTNSATYYPWILDPNNPNDDAGKGVNNLDNVEQVFIESPSSGLYKLVIDHTGTLKDNNPQKVSLIITGIDGDDYVYIDPNGYPDKTFSNSESWYFAKEDIYVAEYQNVTVNSTAYLNMIAGNRIILNPGFKAEYGSKVIGQISECFADPMEKISYWISEDDHNSFNNTKSSLRITPNPSEYHARINYSLSDDTRINLYLVNQIGRKVIELKRDEVTNAGDYKIILKTNKLNSGIYYVILKTDEDIITKQFAVMK